MRLGYLRAAVGLVMVCSASVPAALAMPPDQRVVYHIRESPTDPESAVICDVLLDLSAQAEDGNTVGWRVNRVEIQQDLSGTALVWAEVNPRLGTADGLWWLVHEDPAAPDLVDFSEAPLLEGVAGNETPEFGALVYSFRATTPANPTTPYLHTTHLTFALTQEGDNEPLVEGENEPAEVDNAPTVRA